MKQGKIATVKKVKRRGSTLTAMRSAYSALVMPGYSALVMPGYSAWVGAGYYRPGVEK